MKNQPTLLTNPKILFSLQDREIVLDALRTHITFLCNQIKKEKNEYYWGDFLKDMPVTQKRKLFKHIRAMQIELKYVMETAKRVQGRKKR
jgi:hypothetical protein